MVTKDCPALYKRRHCCSIIYDSVVFQHFVLQRHPPLRHKKIMTEVSRRFYENKSQANCSNQSITNWLITRLVVYISTFHIFFYRCFCHYFLGRKVLENYYIRCQCHSIPSNCPMLCIINIVSLWSLNFRD